MLSPLVSVIIPTYNGADFLGRAIRSVLVQTYNNFELIIVDDKSPDNTEVVVKQFDDSRIKYIRHEINRGAATARGTGRRASSGEIIAFLDQDDIFQPDKIKAHVDFLNDHPEIGFTYNPYFSCLSSPENIYSIAQPPKDLSLMDLVFGFPLPPSSWVVTRKWAFLEDVWDANVSLHGREIIVCSRLFMAGCKFARIDKVLHSRIHHAGRVVSEIEKKCNDELTCQEIILSDSRCPEYLVKLRPLAITNIKLMWINVALSQNETLKGQKFIREILQINPSFLEEKPSELLLSLINFSVSDENHNYKDLFTRLVSQLPPEIQLGSSDYNWAISRGYLTKGIRALIWGDSEKALRYFVNAAELSVELDEYFVQQATYELLNYELYAGSGSGEEILSKLCSLLANIGTKEILNWLRGNYFANRAFQEFGQRNFNKVPAYVFRAMTYHPAYFLNRGIATILLKSLLGLGRQFVR